MSKVVTLVREATKLWYKDFSSRRVAMAIQYSHDNTTLSDEGVNADYRTIYVGWDGEQGRPLHEVLQELETYKNALGNPSVFNKLEELINDRNAEIRMFERASERITVLEKKKWWRW